jgi:hypothetical protein
VNAIAFIDVETNQEIVSDSKIIAFRGNLIVANSDMKNLRLCLWSNCSAVRPRLQNEFRCELVRSKISSLPVSKGIAEPFSHVIGEFSF